MQLQVAHLLAAVQHSLPPFLLVVLRHSLLANFCLCAVLQQSLPLFLLAVLH